MHKHSLQNVFPIVLRIEAASHRYRAAMPAATSSTAGLILMLSMGLLANLGYVGYVVFLISHGNDPPSLERSS
jgi:hypothetical protein